MKVIFKLAFLFVFLNHYTSIASSRHIYKKDTLSLEQAIPPKTTHYASTLKELVDALGNNRKIVITDDIYIKDSVKEVLTDTSKFFMTQTRPDGTGGTPIYKDEFYDIYGPYWSAVDTKEKLIKNNFEEFLKDDIVLIIKKAHNLTITTQNSANIIMRQSENEVVRFDELTNFTLLNLSIFHEVETDGGCGEFAPVISFYDSTSIEVDNCKLNGSGTEGIHTTNVTNLVIKNTAVFNCNKRGFSFENSTGITISNSEIYENNLDADSVYYSGPGIFYLFESQVNVNKTSIYSNTSRTEGRYSILESNSTITFKECYVSDNENFITSPELLSASIDKPIEHLKSNDPIYQQHNNYYITAKSGLNYRTKPKGKLLGKFPTNTKVTVIEHTGIIEKIVDEGKTVKGEWVGIQHKQDTVYVFNAFLSLEPIDLHLRIYRMSPYDNQTSNPSNGEVRTAFVNISETYFENKKYDYLIHEEDLKDTVTLTPRLRKQFLKTVNIYEEETIFIYDIDKDAIHTYKVKDMPVIACPNIYAYNGGSEYHEDDYEFGFDLGKLNISYDNFVYIGKKNPFQTGKVTSMLWKEIDAKKFPKKFDVNVVIKDEYIRSWFDGYTPERSFTFSYNNLNYYIQNIAKDGDVAYRYAVVLKGKKIIYEDVFITSEGSFLNPLDIENEKPVYESHQITGELFKGKPSIIYGFDSHSFGCSSIDFLSNTEPSIRILCDNRH